MPREIEGTIYYEATEVCEKAGISRPTLFRWLKRGLLVRMHRDRRGWRLFTEEDLNKIQAEATRIEIDHVLVDPKGNETQTGTGRPAGHTATETRYANR